VRSVHAGAGRTTAERTSGNVSTLDRCRRRLKPDQATQRERRSSRSSLSERTPIDARSRPATVQVGPAGERRREQGTSAPQAKTLLHFNLALTHGIPMSGRISMSDGITMTNADIECILSRSAAKYYDLLLPLGDDQIASWSKPNT